MHGPPRRLALAIGSLLLFATATVVLLEVRLDYLGTRLPSDLGDPVLVLYLLEWGRHELATSLHHVWDANFYYPATAVLTFADHMLGPAAQGALFRLAWNNGVAAYDFLFLGSFVLTASTTAWVLRRSGLRLAAALFGGLAFAFSPYRFDQKTHLHVLLMQWIPLLLWLWHRLLLEPGWRRGAAFAAVYALHVTGGNYLAYLIHPALAIVLALHWRRWRALVSRRSLTVLLPVLAVCAAVAWTLFHPYVVAHRRLGLERTPEDIRFYGATLRSYVSIERDNRLWGRWLRQAGRTENDLFAGFVITGLAAGGAVAGVVAWARRRRRDGAPPAHGDRCAIVDAGATAAPELALERSIWRRAVIAIGGFFFLLTFAWFYLPMTHVLPGLSAMRVPTRAYALVAFALAVLAAQALDRLLSCVPARAVRAAVAMAVGAALLFEVRSEVPWRRWPRAQDDPAIYHEIGRQPDVRAVLHLPILHLAREAQYMYWSTLDWKPIANGYSGYAPASYVELERRVRGESFEPSTIDFLLDAGITHVVVHPRMLRNAKGRRWLARWERRWSSEPSPRLRLVAAAGDDRLYRLLPGTAGAQ